MQACVERVASLGDYRLEEFRLVEERVMFPLPGELLAIARRARRPRAPATKRAAARAADVSSGSDTTSRRATCSSPVVGSFRTCATLMLDEYRGHHTEMMARSTTPPSA